MTKQIEIHGQRVQLYSLDEGHTWSSSRNRLLLMDNGRRCCAWNCKRGLNA